MLGFAGATDPVFRLVAGNRFSEPCSQSGGNVGIFAIDLVQGGGLVWRKGGLGRRGGRGVQRHPNRAATEQRTQIADPGNFSQPGAPGMFRKIARGLERSFHHLLVEEPFLLPEAADALRPAGGFVVEDLIQRGTDGLRALLVDILHAEFPAVTRGEPAQAMPRAAESRGRFTEGSRGGQSQPGRKEQIVSGRFIGLEGPGGK